MTAPQRLPRAVFLMGPTASGKTDLAVALVTRLPLEVVSVDSALVYREMDIGTAKPGPDVLAQAPHRLIDFLDPSESYSAARFREDALREMADIAARGRVPLLTGGTMLYFRALESGLSALPEADPTVREALEREAAERGWQALHRQLTAVDPEAAARIHPNDPQRLQRALEVYRLTGRPLSAWWREERRRALPFRPLKLVVAPADRARLHERIEQRFRAMLGAGFLEEVERLRGRGDLSPQLPSMRCVGYRQAWRYLTGEWDYETMVERAVIATRQFAKRQFTWLRREPGLAWLDTDDPRMVEKALKKLGRATID